MESRDVKNPTPHGQKRQAEDDLKNEQRLSKRFDLLNLEQNGKLYVPVSQPLTTPPPTRDSWNDSMQLDDSKNCVYIHNLEEELSDVQDEEEKVVFLPDIERKLGKIPQSLLISELHPSANNQMILYGVPSSLSIPKEQDQVRKAIIESRARTRDRQLRETQAESTGQTNGKGKATTLHGPQVNGRHEIDRSMKIETDEDAMDLG